MKRLRRGLKPLFDFRLGVRLKLPEYLTIRRIHAQERATHNIV